jgi:two-component system OmpR family response regulator
MRILLIEDDLALAESLQWGLQAEGYVVQVAHDGIEGLRHATDQTADVIILDVMLPGLDGYQVCARLRAAGTWTPVLMLTALDDDLDQAEGLDLGADDYLSKPFAYPVLLARLRALLRRGATARPTVLEADGLRLDPATRQVTRNGHPIALTAGEVTVLEYLMRAEGRTVSKVELLAHCWDIAYDGDPAVAEVRIHHLRRKVDTPYGTNTIQTVRGAGYRVSA